MVLGSHCSEETKAKISASEKGKATWNKGIPRTSEERAKISAGQAGHIMPESVRLALLRANLGRHGVRSFKTKVCQICGKEYQPTSSNQKWCAGCNPALPTGYKLRLCLECGQEYQPTSGIQKYCLACKQEAIATRNHGYYVGNEDAFMAKSNAGRAARKAAHPQEFSQHIAAYARNYRTLHPDPMHIIDARHAAKRRILGFNPLNFPFPGCEGHHLNQSDVVYIPLELHCSIPHNVFTGKNMDKINALALQWLGQQS